MDFDDCGNLDIHYPRDGFIKDEATYCYKHSDDSITYMLEYCPITFGSVCASVFYDEKLIQNILESQSKTDILVNSLFISNDNEPRVVSMDVNHNTSLVTLKWDKKVDKDKVKMLVTYKFDIEM